jgi:hypothetical protein
MTADQDIGLVGAVASALAVCIAVATYLLVRRQIAIANKQTSIAEEQKQIALEQTKISADQLSIAAREITLVEQQGKILEHQEHEMNRKAHLVLWTEQLPYREFLPANIRVGSSIELGIVNDGNRTADACTIILLLDPAFVSIGTTDSGDNVYRWRNVGPYDFQDVRYARFELDVQRFFFMRVPVMLPTMMVEQTRAAKADAVLYGIAYADGTAPGDAWRALGTKSPL